MAAAPDNRRFQLLGPLHVEIEGREVPIVGRKPRTLLALLLLRAGEVVSRDELIDALWPGDPPETAANTIQVYVSQLRRALGSELVRTQSNGYVVTAARETIDVHRFERLVDEGHRTGLAPDTTVRLLDEALGLWHGRPLPELPAEAVRLSELRLQAIGRRIDAELELGRHSEVLAELESLTRTEPYREQFTAQLMVALYRSARQAEALGAFQRLRTTLSEELGLEPTRELRELERAILNQEPSLEGVRSPPSVLLSELRKPVTVLAAAFARSHELDVEADALVAARLAAHALRIVAEHDGLVLPTVDGTLVALFGVPYVHEDDARRATLAALELERTLPEICAELGPQLAPALGMRAAVGTTIAVVPAPEQGATSVPAAVAASTVALARHAPESAILLDATTHALLRNEVAAERFDDLPPGRATWRLTGIHAPERISAAPFVGRRTELARLEAAFHAALANRSVVERLILGGAGVGKTRLVDELVRALGAAPVVLRAACRPIGARGLSVLRMLAGEALGDPADGGDLVVAVAALLTRLAADRPVVAILDDFELAEHELVEAVHAVAAQSYGPILVLTLARRSDENTTALKLDPLPPADALRLADRLLELRVDSAVREQVAAAGEGNPLFIEQLAAAVAEGGELSPLPPTIQALLAARLDRLTPDERRALQAGAVVGRTFAAADAGELLATKAAAMETVLAGLERRRLVAAGAHGTWRFRHSLLWEAAYGSIPKRDRSALHERAATAASNGDDAVAYHLERAWRLLRELGERGDELEALRERAISALVTAGENAFHRVDVQASRSLLSRAAELMHGDDSRRGALLVDLAETIRGGGEPREALAVLDELGALGHVDPLVDAQAHLVRLRILHVVDSAAPTSDALAELESALRLFEEAGDHARLADGWYLRAWFYWLRCLAGPADEALDRSVAFARKANDRRLEGNAIHLKVGVVLYGPHPVDDGVDICGRLLDDFADEPRIVASASRGLAGLLAMQGRFAEAHEHIARDQALTERLGLKIAAAAGTELYAFVHLLEGDLGGAEAALRSGCACFEEMGERNSLSTLYAALAQVRWRRGDVEETLELATRAADFAAAEDLHTQVQARGPRAKALAALGRHHEAEFVARDGVELGQTTDFLPMRALAALDLAEVLLLAGRGDEARTTAGDAVRLYEAKGFTVGARIARGVVESGGVKSGPRAGVAPHRGLTAP